MVGEVVVLEGAAAYGLHASLRYLSFLTIADDEVARRLQSLCDVVGRRDARLRPRAAGFSTVGLQLELLHEPARRSVSVGPPIASGCRVLSAMFTIA